MCATRAGIRKSGEDRESTLLKGSEWNTTPATPTEKVIIAMLKRTFRGERRLIRPSPTSRLAPSISIAAEGPKVAMTAMSMVDEASQSPPAEVLTSKKSTPIRNALKQRIGSHWSEAIG